MGELPISLVTEGGTLEFRKVGETVDLVLGPALLDQLGLKAGDMLQVVGDIQVAQAESDVGHRKKVADIMSDIMVRYRDTLEALAK